MNRTMACLTAMALCICSLAFAEKITVAGSTTVQPLAEKLALAYESVAPGVTVEITGGGSSVGVTSVGNGSVDLGACSRDVTQAEFERFPGLEALCIARDGIAIIVGPEVSVTNLSKSQVRDIFTGDISNWSEVGGPDEAIVLVSREEGSGTRSAFENIVLADAALISGAAVLQPSNGAVVTTVSTTPYSIGYVSFGYLNESVTALSVNGVAATVENAQAARYPIVRPLLLVAAGDASPLVQGWLDFIMSPAGQSIVEAEGYLPVGPVE
ncbi:MAG TPA: phosphate ABC transporter substrate-binding protein [Candidatus Fermentibacter daniensis]|jgi:phosphate transport system substrate-binding protein|nr:MAG: hypothetical protein AO395_03360 [Candidatus Fermentibacter daniensis]MBP7720776.1 phosphate ABC transporter substrate-binding protein [Candidatus Fermentibacter sp.]OQC70466.1 MAG: Phosphate-binding protein PstS 1 precursor [candidate division Hyd24-12 bacterium ADurb.Bin004]KZD17057.1 MAG: hypothetical protein AO396_00685 [Candidatus Fermentibacter daniensis]KZD17761.1 MAG: hypothetical protein AO394_04410 [Candidatus Fermentibacter daniensis]